MNEPDAKQSSHIDDLLAPFVANGFFGEVVPYLTAYADFFQARQACPPLPTMPALDKDPSQFWDEIKQKYGDGVFRGFFLLLFRSGQARENTAASLLLHQFLRKGLYPCLRLHAFVADATLPSGVRQAALSIWQSFRKEEDSNAFARELAPFAEQSEPDDEVRKMALLFLSRLDDSGLSGPATRKLLEGDDLRYAVESTSRLWRHPNPTVLPLLKKALSGVRQIRPYRLHDVQKLAEAIVVCRGSEPVEALIYDVLGDALFWDYRFPESVPESLLVNLTTRLSNSLTAIKSPAAVEFAVRFYIHATAWGTDLDRGVGRQFGKQLGESAQAELKIDNPRVMWGVWACSISGEKLGVEGLKALLRCPNPDTVRAAGDALKNIELGDRFPDVRGRLSSFDRLPMREVMDLGDAVEMMRPSPERSRFSFVRRLSGDIGSWIIERDLTVRKVSGEPIIWTAEWVDQTRMALRHPSNYDFTVIDMDTGKCHQENRRDWEHLRRRGFAITVPDIHQESVAEFIVRNFYPGTTLDEAALSPDGQHLAFVLGLKGQSGFVGAAFLHDVGTSRFRLLDSRVGSFIWRGNTLIFAEGPVRGAWQKGGRVFEVQL